MAVSTGRTLAEALAEGPVLLDGGLSNQLEAQGCDLSDALWSARLLADAPEQIEAAHLAYLRSGAQVLITASYQATFEGFGRHGIGPERTGALLARSVELARRAAGAARRADPGREVWVAASVGPYGAMLADGSEYRGRYGLTVRELERFHRPGDVRHGDHRFEWTRAEFRVWAGKVAERHGYTVAHLPVGPDDPEVGPPTQLAVFTLTDTEIDKKTDKKKEAEAA
ncbi:hypothetical protein SMICM304S_01728 [Streptomyces microflavus]